MLSLNPNLSEFYHLRLSVKNSTFHCLHKCSRHRLPVCEARHKWLIIPRLITHQQAESESLNNYFVEVSQVCLSGSYEMHLSSSSSLFYGGRCGNLISFHSVLTCCNNTQNTEWQQKLHHFYLFFLSFPFLILKIYCWQTKYPLCSGRCSTLN